MAPIHDGDSQHFWRYATGVRLTPEMEEVWGGDAYFVDDDWAAYDASHLHGSTIYRVPAKEALVDFEKVVAQLERESNERTDNPSIQGYLSWRDGEREPKSAQLLLENINAAMRKRYLEASVDVAWLNVAQEQLFWQRWRRARFYWTNHVFDWAYLSALAAFLLWPGIRGKPFYRWSIHLALGPLLLMLPCYLGYASTTFTSCGPNGGVLYPQILIVFRRGWFTSLDRWILSHTPPLLESLTVPLGFPIATTGLGMPGPLSAVVAGLVLGAASFGIHLAIRLWRGNRHAARCAPVATTPES
jgi:hypothetical protein